MTMGRSEETSPHHWTIRQAAPAALLAGFLWLALWAHQQLAHGPTEVNEQILVFGFTWMDSGKLYVAVFMLLMVTMTGLHLRGRPGRLGKVGFALVMTSLILITVGTAFQFWPFPLGSYHRSFEDIGGGVALPLQPLGTLLLTVSIVLFTLGLVKARTLGRWIVWMVPLLAIGAATTIFLTPALVVPGLVWLTLGVMLWTREPRRHHNAEPGASVGHSD